MTPFRSWQLTLIAAIISAGIIVLMQGCGGASAADTPVAAQPESAEQGDPRGNKDPIIGVWEVTVTVHDCVTGAELSRSKGLGQVHAGGTAIADNASPPNSHSLIMGTWQNEGHGRYGYQMTFLRFMPDGTWDGTTKAKGTRTLGADGNSFQSAAIRQNLDRDGNLLNQICVTEDGQRVTW